MTRFVAVQRAVRAGAARTASRRSRARCAASTTRRRVLPTSFDVPRAAGATMPRSSQRAAARAAGRATRRSPARGADRRGAAAQRAAPVPQRPARGQHHPRARDGRVMIVDWEYAGMGDPRFDLGNLSVNNDFDDATTSACCAAYHGEPPSDARRARAEADARALRRPRGRVGRRAGDGLRARLRLRRLRGEHFERLRDGERRAEQLGSWLRR